MSEPTSPVSGPSIPLLIRAELRSDVGRVRSENQDFGTMSTAREESGTQSAGGRLLIVADGMGGHRGGATASRVAAETLKEHYLGSGNSDPAVALFDALTRANARVFSEAQSNPDLRGMGTTTSALALRGNQAWFAHVGDSRIYLVRNGAIKQLTDDHSLVASMVREGLLTAKEAETHPRRNVLQRSVGVSEDVEIDVRGPMEVVEGDTFILCSDGLHGLVKEDEMKTIAAQPIAAAADEFIKRALERGAPDNVTVIVARAERAAADAVHLDETQLDRHDHDLFEDTVRDVPKPSTREALIPTIETPAPVAVAAPAAPATSQPAAKPPASSGGRPLMKWLLLVVMVLGAAGVLIYRIF